MKKIIVSFVISLSLSAALAQNLSPLQLPLVNGGILIPVFNNIYRPKDQTVVHRDIFPASGEARLRTSLQNNGYNRAQITDVIAIVRNYFSRGEVSGIRDKISRNYLHQSQQITSI